MEKRYRHPLDAIPSPAPGVESKQGPRGNWFLSRTFAPHATVLGRIWAKLGFITTKRLVLDEAGSAFWELADGSRNLRMIAKTLAEKTGCSENQARKACLVFTRDLMVRQLLQVRVHK